MAGHHHRSSIRNGHKTFKSKHSSKGALKRLHKGKVEREVASNKALKGESKLQRRNKAKQIRTQKVMAALENRRLFEGANGAEKIVTIIPLTEDCNPQDAVEKLFASAEVQQLSGDENYIPGEPSVKNYYVKQYKCNLKVIIPDLNNFMDILDAAKIADYVVFQLSGVTEVEQDLGEQIIRALELQGIASYLGVISNLSQVHPKEKFQLDVKQSLESYFKHFFPNEDKLYNLEKSSDSLNVLRNICQKLPRNVSWRDSRGYLVADEIDFKDVNDQYCELMVRGTVRGTGFNANRLVHIPNLGDFQVSKIEKLKASTKSDKKSNKKTTTGDALIDELEEKNYFESNENRETLDEFAPEDIEFEEWSDEEDYEYDQLTSARFDDGGYLPTADDNQKRVKVPKGTSSYQAKWYLDDVVNPGEEVADQCEDEIQEDMMIADDDEMIMEDENDSQPIMDNREEDEEDEAEMFVDLSPEEEERQLQEFRALEDEDREFPDEIELSPNESGIERLKRYRGLKNLHNCIWDVDEKDPDCPEEWKRLLRIGSYKNTRNRLLKEAINDAEVIAGDRIKIYLSFPKNLLEKLVSPQSHAVALYGLLPHEHKNTVANFSLQRWEAYDKPVPAQEPIIVQYGIRRYTINPLFSADTNSSNNVHKSERFLHPDVQSIATCIAPVDFTQSPAIFFKPSTTERTGIELIGHGTFLNADHSRVMAKRAILTGHPFRFHKNVITVRYMFFNPQDVEWFKSIPLFTKTGRSGFIKESLGTHGYFKANFDTKLSAQDVVAMSLYKRMWPMASAPWEGEY